MNRLARDLGWRGIIALCGCGLLLISCLAQPRLEESEAGPELQIAGVEIYNGLPYSVQDVSILVPSSGEFVSCGQILPDSSCSTTFPVRDYRESPAQVSWTEHGVQHSTKPFKLKAPLGAKAGQGAYIRVEVFASGQAGAKLLLLESNSP